MMSCVDCTLLTQREAAERLSISQTKLRELIRSGLIPVVHTDTSRFWISVEALHEFVCKSAAGGAG